MRVALTQETQTLRAEMIRLETEALKTIDPARKVKLFEQALEKARAARDAESEASLLQNLGEATQMLDLNLALSYFQQTQTVAHALPSPGREAYALRGQAATYTTLRQKAKAIVALQEGVRLYGTVTDKAGRAGFLTACAYTYLNLGEIAQALKHLEQAEQLSREVGDLRGAATARNIHGELYRRTNQNQKALENAQVLLSLHRALKDSPEEVIDTIAIAHLYAQQGEAQKALGYFLEALRLGQAYAQSMLVAKVLSEIGSLYESEGDFANALHYSQEALQLFHMLNQKTSLAWQYGKLGILWAHLKQPEKALTSLKEALQLNEALKLKAQTGETHQQFGEVYQQLGQPQKALASYQRALALQRAAGDPLGEATTLTHLAELYQEKQPALARHYFQSALLLYRVRGERLGEVQLLAALGHLESVAGRSREAESFYRSAIALSEQLRTDAGSGFSSQGAFFEQLSSPYVGYLTLLVEQRRVAEAFVLAQKTKARGLLDLMAGGKIDLRQQLSESEQAEEQQRRQKCDSLSEAMVREAALNALGSKKRFEAIKRELLAAKRELLAAEQELAVFHDTLYARHPSLGQRRAATTANLEQVAKALPAHAALLEFAPLASGRVALFVVTCDQRGKASVSVSRLAVSATELERQARGLRTACTNPKKSWRREAQRLYQVLLAPVEARLAGKTQLIFCPDRSLWDVPFAVLADPEGVPLLTRFAISYASSATTWHAAQATPRKPTSSPKLLVLANPQFDAERRFENDPAVAGQRPLTAPNRPLTAPNRPLTAPNRDFLLPRGIRLVDLPGTQREADALAKRFPNTTLYTRSKAQESIVKQDANKFQRLHLASHAFVNDASPLLSSVVLANPSPTSSDDGFLTAREIFELDLSHLELVVLSACNTARGAQHGGEGVMGLTWALFAAGCPTQVLSQWGVDDASTATLMTRFYDGLAKGVGKSAALRQAALHVRSEPRHHHPYYWAPFVLIGDPR